MDDKKQNSKPATKSDLLKAKSELKRDIERLETATKSDLLAVKTELDKKIDSVASKLEKVYISQVQADSKLDKKMDSILDKINDIYSRIMSAFEQTVVKGAKYDQKAETHGAILMAHEDKPMAVPYQGLWPSNGQALRS